MNAKKKHTQAELAEALVFSVALTPAQKKEAAKQLATARKKARKEMTERNRLALQLLKF